MLSILVFSVLLLAAAVNQAILTLSGRRDADKYCVANRKVTDVAALLTETMRTETCCPRRRRH
jgi:hypothetical protein